MIDQVMDLRPQTAAAVQAAFDYSQIEEQYRDEVKTAANSIRQLGKAMQTSIVAIGKRLIEVKDMLPYGQFGEWIAAEFDMSDRTARNFMNVAREYGNRTEIISVLSDTVLYLLAAPSTPEEARTEIEQAAASGQKVTVEDTKEAIRKARPEPVQYAPVWQLNANVAAWLAREIGETGTPSIDTVIDMLKTQVDQPLRPGSWLELIDTAIKKEGIHFRTGDLTQAINNVREQRRQTRRQATARAVYIEPTSSEDQTVTLLLSMDIQSDAFKAVLLTATVEQLDEALKRVPSDTDKWRFVKIGDRRHLLLIAQQAEQVDDVIGAILPAAEPRQISAAKPDHPDLQKAGFVMHHTDQGYRYFWPTRGDRPQSYGPIRYAQSQAVEDALAALALTKPAAVEPKAPPLSKVEVINRDLDAYDAAMRREVAEWQAAPLDQADEDDTEMPAQQLLATPDDLAARGYVIVPSQDGKGWRWKRPNGEGGAVYSAPYEAIGDAVTHARKCIAIIKEYPPAMIEAGLDVIAKAKEPPPEPDPRIALSALLIESAQATQELFRKHYGELTGRHTDLLVWERDTEALIEPLDSLIEILSGGANG